MQLPERRVGRPTEHKLNKQVFELHLKGITDKEIAGVVNKTRGRVGQIIKKQRDEIELSTAE